MRPVRPWLRLALPFLSLLLALPAAAAPRLAIAPIRGDRSQALHRQLSAALCPPAGCAPWADASVKGKVDPARARRRGVGGALVGSVPAKGKGQLLILALYTTSRKPAQTWSLPLTRQRSLAPEELEALRRDLAGRLGPEMVAAPPPPPPQAVEARPRAAPQPVPLPPPPVPRAPAPRPQAPAPVPAPAAAPPASPPPRPAGPRGPYVAGEVGLATFGRTLSYQGVSTGTATLRGFDVSLIFSPRLRLELYPAAAAPPLLAGLGVFADVSTSVGLKTQVEGTPEKRGTTVRSLEGGLLWRAPLTRGLVLVPAVSYASASAKVSPSIPGLPDASLSGLKGSLGAEVQVVSRVWLLAGGGYVAWSGKKELIGPAYFPGGSARGLSLDAGAAVDLGSGVSLRGRFEYRQTRYSLDPDPLGAYAATGARDTCTGGSLTVRGQY